MEIHTENGIYDSEDGNDLEAININLGCIAAHLYSIEITLKKLVDIKEKESKQ